MNEKVKTESEEAKAVPLAIVGIGCLFPKANDAASYWSNIREGVDAIEEIPDTHWKPEDYFDADKNAPDMTYARRGGFIDAVDFDPLLYGLSPNNIEATDSTQLLGMVVARQALLDAGYATAKDSDDGRPFNRDRTSVILGVTGTLELVIPLGARLGHPIWRKALADAGVEGELAEDVVQRIADGYVPWQENSFPGLLGNVAAGRIANRFDLGGTNCVVDAACASSLSAVHMAALELYSGRTDMAITGGFDTFNDIFMYMCFSKTPALSPTGNSKPFDHNGDGTILGEGLGAVILKRLDDAQRDGDKIYAVLKGIGSSSDGRGNAIYAPSANGQTKALRNAYDQAGVTPRSIELVEAHGTGTKVGDAVEATALSEVYREDQAEGSWCAIGSVKSMIGHTKAAAGVAGLIKIAMALKYKVLPPTIKVEQPLDLLQPGEAPVYVNSEKRPWLKKQSHPRRAALSAFGFGGSNFHCVLEEAEQVADEVEWDGKVLLFSFSAANNSSLAAALKKLNSKAPWLTLRAQAAQSLKRFDASETCRLLLVVNEKTDLEKLLSTVTNMLTQKADERSWNTPDGAFYGSGNEKGKLAMLFPGQGSQYSNMLRDLTCQFPQMQKVISDACSIFAQQNDENDLGDLIFPVAAFSDDVRKKDEEKLRATQHAQPAIGATSLGALKILQHFGIQAEATAGHSFGELSALCAAGRISDEALHKLAIRRGELMKARDGDRGAMLAVSASAAVVHEFLEAVQLDLIIANNNAPTQVVLSGASDQIELAAERLQERGIAAKKLPVSAAFHSIYVADAEKPLAEFLQNIAFDEGGMDVYANTSAEVYPQDADAARVLLAGQLAKPVEFVTQIENMYEQGFHSFIEVGPGKTLSTLVSAILADREHQSVALDVSRGKRSGQFDLACLLAQLVAVGHECDLTQWDAGFSDSYNESEASSSKMTVPVSGANYVKERPARPAIKKPPADPVKNIAAPAVPASVLASTTHEHKSVRAQTNVHLKSSGSNAQEALQVTQQSILTLQKMQEQTAALHKQYLEGQQLAQQNLQELLRQQQALLNGGEISIAQAPAASTVQNDMPVIATPAVPVEPRNEQVEADHATQQEDTEPATATDNTDYESLLLEVVADKTGYPVEMLSMDMSLDTDLGIDSIKRVEILSALQEQLPGKSTVQPEDLGTFQMLKHIVEFLAADARNTSPARVAASPLPAVADDRFQTVLLEVVADKTGYPTEMLNLDMNMDTDLGIDSIKRVEILSAFQEAMPEAPTVNPEDLASLQTLQQIVDFMRGQTQPAIPISDAAASSSIESEKLQSVLLDVVAEKTGYPVDMLNPDMNMDTDLGIDSIKRVEILSAFQEAMPEAPAVNAEDLSALQTLAQIVEYMTAEAGPAAKVVEAIKETRVKEEQIHNSVFRCAVELEALITTDRKEVSLAEQSLVLITDDGTDLPAKLCQVLEKKNLRGRVIQTVDELDEDTAGVIIMAPAKTSEEFNWQCLQLAQRFALMLQSRIEKRTALFAGVTRMGGDFGLLTEAFTSDPYAAGLGGLVKTADKEWPEVNCKSIDIPARRSSLKLAENIVTELLLSGPLETGLSDEGAQTPVLNSVEVEYAARPANPFTSNETVVITGGARGVTAEVALALAQEWQTNLILLGRSEVETKEADWLVNLRDEVEIKKALMQHSGISDLTPARLEKEYAKIQANREVVNNLQRMRDCGVEVHYRSVDVRDTQAVTDVLEELRSLTGPITGLIHGAGVLADKFIADKSREQFDQVYATKVTGAASLLAACTDDPLRVIVMFSSSTARFGRKGQVDYAMANEVLNKIARAEEQKRSDCRVLSINWGPWDGGMVTPQLKKLFESEGVGVIPLKDGANYLLQEISAKGPVEIVVLGSEPAEGVRSVSAAESSGTLQQVMERRISVDDHPVLKSHVMNGKAVLPAALIAEWLAHGAMHNHPGLTFLGFEDLRILKGVIVNSDESCTLQILAGNSDMQGQEDHVHMELRSGPVLHARAIVILGNEYNKAPSVSPQTLTGDYAHGDGEYYRNHYLFHGDALQCVEKVMACNDKGIEAKVAAAPQPSKWMQQPVRSSWLSDPMLVDGAFQLMILWSIEHSGKPSLPTRVGRYQQFRRKLPKEGCTVRARLKHVSEHAARADIDFIDDKGHLLARMEDYECVIDESLKNAFRNNSIKLPA